MSNEKETVKEKTFHFSVRIINLYKYLCNTKNEYVLSKQLLRSGTSIGANVREAQNGHTKADFVCKLNIAQKETDETMYWLELLKETGYLADKEFETIYQDAQEILKMLRS